jgi:hypothetical protein
MTAWTPELKIYQYPPNADLLSKSLGTEVTDLVDYSISISKGTDQYISAPYPTQTSVTLIFDENRIPEIYLGSYLQVTVREQLSGNFQPIAEGYVINRTSSYRAYGLTGFILEWTFTLASGISILQNTNWYNPETFTGTTEQCINRLNDFYGYLQWDQINSSIDWTEIGGTTWNSFDNERKKNLPPISTDTETTQQTLTAGQRNIWDDLVTLVYGVYGSIWETSNGFIQCTFVTNPFQPALALTQDVIGIDIAASDSVDEIRNIITVTEFDGVESTYYNDDSITLYQERSGSINTYLNSTLDAADIGQYILNSLSFPSLAVKQISVDLINNNVSNAQRFYLYAGGVSRQFEVEAPLPMGGTLEYRCIGAQMDINKNTYTVNLYLTPFASIENSQNWAQIPYNYTWTSYGVAFPTQEWQDL